MKNTMNREIKLILLIIFNIIICTKIISCSPNNRIIQIIKQKYKKYNLLKCIEGNFTNSGNNEYIVFFEDPAKRYEGNENLPPKINKVFIFIFNNSNLINEIKLDIFSSGYREYDLEIIKNINNVFGPWHDYCYIKDFNRNGFDEIVFFSISGRDFVVYFIEYKNEKFEYVLKSPDYEILVDIEAVDNEQEKYIKIYLPIPVDLSEEDLPEDYIMPAQPYDKDHFLWQKYVWSEAKGIYDIVESGLYPIGK